MDPDQREAVLSEFRDILNGLLDVAAEKLNIYESREITKGRFLNLILKKLYSL